MKDRPTRVAVMGAGAVGSFIGVGLGAAGADVTLVARGAHLAAMRRDGLTLVTQEGERTTIAVRATSDPSEIGPVDYVLFTVKSYDTEAAMAQIAPLVGEGTAIVCLQNGVDNETKLAARYGEDHVIAGATYVLASIEGPGVIRSGPSSIVVGELRAGPPSERVERLVALANAGGVHATASRDARRAKWEKYVLLVAFSAVTATTQLTIGDLRPSRAAIGMLRAIMHEAWSVGRALGIDLPDDLVERQHALILKQRDDEGSSLRHDLLTGHRMELDALQGTLIRLGREAGVPTPWTEAAYAILEPWSIRNGSPGQGQT